jgi:hypothetical protein
VGRQTCKACGREDYWNFDVPDDVWIAVVPEEFRFRVVCLPCFDRFAFERGVGYAASLRTIYFAGDMAAFEFATVSASNSDDCYF